MSAFIVNLPEKLSGAALEAEVSSALKNLIAMEKKDLAIIADPNKYLAKGGDFMEVIEAFAELSGYINGTNPEWDILYGKLNNEQTSALKGALKSVLSNFNDVKIPVGTDDGRTVYARVYTDASEKTPATAWDFVNNWLNVTGSKHPVDFFFNYTNKHISRDSKPAWAGNDSSFHSGCGGSEHKYFNPTGEAGGGVAVHEQDAGNHCHHMTYNIFHCSGDAQALAGFCNFSSQNKTAYNGDDVLNKYLDNSGLGFNL